MSKSFKLIVFLSSFFPLWINIIFIDVINICINKDKNILLEKITIWVLLILLIVTSILFFYFFIKIKNETSNKKCKILKANKQSYTTEFLLAYILPLFAFDFTIWIDFVQFIFYFIILAFLSIRNDIIYANVLLEILGYTTYHCTVSSGEIEQSIIVMYKNKNLTSQIGNEVNLYELDKPYYIGMNK